jgi:hypothetical protein
MNTRMDAAVPMDAQNAPTGTWKTAQNAVSHSAHTHHSLVAGERRRASETSVIRLTHRNPDTPRREFVSRPNRGSGRVTRMGGRVVSGNRRFLVGGERGTEPSSRPAFHRRTKLARTAIQTRSADLRVCSRVPVTNPHSRRRVSLHSKRVVRRDPLRHGSSWRLAIVAADRRAQSEVPTTAITLEVSPESLIVDRADSVRRPSGVGP